MGGNEWVVGMGRGKGREWGEGRELGKAEWEREGGRQGELGTVGGRGGLGEGRG